MVFTQNVMLVTHMSSSVWRSEFAMIEWDLGGKPDSLLGNEDDDLDIEPDRE